MSLAPDLPSPVPPATVSGGAVVSAPLRRPPLPLPWAVAYTLFLAVLVPVYLTHYGPTNFLYFCDLALLLTAATVWSGRALPASIAAVAILVPQGLWIVDFVLRLAGVRLLGMTDYMFDHQASPFLRCLSLFHLWLPLLLWWIVRRTGYDRRAFAVWLPCGLAVLLVNWLLLPAPPAPPDQPGLPVNVNLVYGLSDDAPQRWMPAWAWFAAMTGGLALLAWLPTHLLLRKVMPRPAPGR